MRCMGLTIDVGSVKVVGRVANSGELARLSGDIVLLLVDCLE